MVLGVHDDMVRGVHDMVQGAHDDMAREALGGMVGD
jgi:hypothetical protein